MWGYASDALRRGLSVNDESKYDALWPPAGGEWWEGPVPRFRVDNLVDRRIENLVAISEAPPIKLFVARNHDWGEAAGLGLKNRNAMLRYREKHAVRDANWPKYERPGQDGGQGGEE